MSLVKNVLDFVAETYPCNSTPRVRTYLYYIKPETRKFFIIEKLLLVLNTKFINKMSEVGFEPTPSRVDCDLNARPLGHPDLYLANTEASLTPVKNHTIRLVFFG